VTICFVNHGLIFVLILHLRSFSMMVSVVIQYDAYPEFLQVIGSHPKDDNTNIVKNLEPSLA